MSIYATLWEIKIPRHHEFDEEFVSVYAQWVPSHIGHPSSYPDRDPYADFLPPVVQDYDPETGTAPYQRAVVIVQDGRDKKEIQQYVDPLLVLMGEEYARIPFGELLGRIHRAMNWDNEVIAMALLPGGPKKLIKAKKNL